MKKGFTLIELLVVIAILAVLAVAVIVIINPAELLRQGRDSTRLSDLSALQNAIALYLADVKNPTIGHTNYCTASSTGGAGDYCPSTNVTISSSTAIDGNGWVPIDLSAISSGSPLSRLPLDPVNDEKYFYVYAPTSTQTSTNYELNANMESTKYKSGGGSDVESTDGGNQSNVYEVGNDLTINATNPSS